jgi:phosphoesterase RecJ-like protein
VDHIRAVEGTVVAALIREQLKEGREGVSKVSLRAATDDVDVSVIARKEGGGGHRQAAGFSTEKSGTELIDFIRAEIAAQA